MSNIILNRFPYVIDTTVVYFTRCERIYCFFFLNLLTVHEHILNINISVIHPLINALNYLFAYLPVHEVYDTFRVFCRRVLIDSRL